MLFWEGNPAVFLPSFQDSIKMGFCPLEAFWKLLWGKWTLHLGRLSFADNVVFGVHKSGGITRMREGMNNRKPVTCTPQYTFALDSQWVLISCVLLNLQIVVTQIKIPTTLVQVLSAGVSGWQQWCLTSSSSIKKIQPDYKVGIFFFPALSFFAWNFNLHVF